MGNCRSSSVGQHVLARTGSTSGVGTTNYQDSLTLVVRAAFTGEEIAVISLHGFDLVERLNQVMRQETGVGIMKLLYKDRTLESHATLSDAGLVDGSIITALRCPVVDIYAMQLATFSRGVPQFMRVPKRVWLCLSAHLGVIEKMEKLKERLVTHLDHQSDTVRKMVLGRLHQHIDMFFSRALMVPGFTRPDLAWGCADILRLWGTTDVAQTLTIVAEIFWLRLGSLNFHRSQGGEELPQMPADIIGRLAPEYGSLFFYYKDCDPSIWGGGGTVHPGYCFYVSRTLWELVENLSLQDRAAFFRMDEWWTKNSMNTHEEPGELCTCLRCVYRRSG